METQLINQDDLRKLIEETPATKCVCGHEYFERATMVKELSPITSPTGTPKTLLIEVLLCRKCGTKLEQSKLIT